MGNSEDDWRLAAAPQQGGGGSVALSHTRSRTRQSSKQDSSRRNLFVDAAVVAIGDGDSSVASSITDSTLSSINTRKFWKPPESRVIIEVNAVQQMLEKYLESACPSCGSALKLTFPTTCIASGCRLTCVNNEGCTYADLCKPCGSNVPLEDDASQKIKRNTDFALNVLYVVSFIASGDGGTEAARLLGMLGLPNNTTMQSRSFGNIERMLSPTIQEYTEELLRHNLEKEVELVLGDRMDEKGDKLYQLWLDKKLIEPLWPRIDGCADMGWQQKGSGRKRDSKSGHALTIAMLTRKAVAMETCSKGCGYCKTWRTRHTVDEEPPKHKCFINHDGTSGSMEPLAVLRMYIKLYNDHQVIVRRFVLDDDASTKSKLKWSNKDYMENTGATQAPKIINKNGNLGPRPNHGAIPAYMPEPSFVADPNHRRKTLSNDLWKLALRGKTSPEEQRKQYEKKKKKQEIIAEQKGLPPPTIPAFKLKPWNITMTSSDCRRISKNFAFMARTLKDKNSDQEMLEAGKAVLEHHFDCHHYCGGWCRRKKELALQQQQQQQNEQQQQDDAGEVLLQQMRDVNKKFYRNKKDPVEALLYNKLTTIVARFVTLEALKEVAHDMDTCANESFNNTASWVAPKNKVYCGTHSLKNRLSIALGIYSIGTMAYYEGLFQRLGIEITADVRHYLRVTSAHRDRRNAKYKTTDYKRRRKRAEMVKIERGAKEASIARANRYGVYKSGIGMESGYDVQELGNNDEDSRKPSAKSSATVASSKLVKPCKCGATDHKRTTSTKCPLNKRNKKGLAAAEDTSTAVAAVAVAVGLPENETQAMADETDKYDSLALRADDIDSDAGVNSEDYFSANSEFSNGSFS